MIRGIEHLWNAFSLLGTRWALIHPSALRSGPGLHSNSPQHARILLDPPILRSARLGSKTAVFASFQTERAPPRCPHLRNSLFLHLVGPKNTASIRLLKFLRSATFVSKEGPHSLFSLSGHFERVPGQQVALFCINCTENHTDPSNPLFRRIDAPESTVLVFDSQRTLSKCPERTSSSLVLDCGRKK